MAKRQERDAAAGRLSPAKRKERDDARDETPEVDPGYQLRFLLVEKGARIIEVGVRYGLLALCFYLVTSCINGLAGQRTIADIGVRFLAEVKFSEAAAWIFGAGSFGYGVRQRNLRRKDTKQMGARLRRYEKLIDPRRSSSNLDSEGDYEED